MPKTVRLDEWHVTFRIPADLPDAEVRAIRRVLNGEVFTAAVRRAIRAVLKQYPELCPLRMDVTR